MSFMLALGPGARTRLEAMARAWSCPLSHVQQIDEDGFSVRVYTHDPADPRSSRDPGISQAHGVTLALEGYILGQKHQGEALRRHLIECFLKQGVDFVAPLEGCFRLAVHVRGETWVFSDRLGLRPLFQANDGHGPLWAAAAAPLLAVIPQRSLDGANLLQFLFAGRFFSGGSLFRELRQQAPATCVHYCPPNLATRSWYRYQLESVECEPDQLREVLSTLLNQAVDAHYAATVGRCLMLSGGYDSRYLLNTLAERFGRDHGVFTWLWCELDERPESDLGWARREAARLGTPFEAYPILADLASQFQKNFDAQSGMTEQVFTHTDEQFYCRMLHEDRGMRAMFRGDEIFGANGPDMATKEQALASVGLVQLDRFASAQTWFRASIGSWQKEHRQAIDERAQGCDDPNDLRDLLYCCERLPALQAHLNAQRLPYLETHNPMLNLAILEFVRRLPARWRTDKRLFRELYHQRFPTTGFATTGNGFDWMRLMAPESREAKVLRDHLANLPEPFDRHAFLNLFTATRKGEIPTAPEAGPLKQVPPWRWMARAMVLGEWLRRWPTSP